MDNAVPRREIDGTGGQRFARGGQNAVRQPAMAGERLASEQPAVAAPQDGIREGAADVDAEAGCRYWRRPSS